MVYYITRVGLSSLIYLEPLGQFNHQCVGMIFPAVGKPTCIAHLDIAGTVNEIFERFAHEFFAANGPVKWYNGRESNVSRGQSKVIWARVKSRTFVDGLEGH